MILRIYKKNNNVLMNIINNTKNITNKETIKMQRYLNLIKEIKNNTTEVYTEQTELLYENDEYIVILYIKNNHENELFPNLKVYSYDKNIDYWEININVKQIEKIKLEEIKIKNGSINFLEIKLNDDFKELDSIKILLDQIKQQILNHI
jgi:hypothetical protein